MKQRGAKYGLPVRTEFHTRPFLLGKNPYKSFGFTEATRIAIIDDYCAALASLDAKIVNVCIVKPRIKSTTYKVLDIAMKYSIQRVENDMRFDGGQDARFLVITDPGRVGKMRKTTRRVQRINFIPSMFGRYAYRREVERLIEDPLPKDSRESYFIQSADLVSYLVFLHAVFTTKHGRIHGRMPVAITAPKVESWLRTLTPILNLKAAKNPYGILFHPA